MQKKIMLICVAVILFSICCMSVSATNYVDVISNEYEAEIQMAVSLGIMDINNENQFYPDGLVTRDEFGKMLTYFSNTNTTNISSNEYLTFEDITKAFMDVLNYNEIIKTGKLDITQIYYIAKNIGLYNNLKVDLSKNINRAELAVMFNNLLNSKFQYITQISTDGNNTIYNKSDETYIGKMKKIKLDSGILIANDIAMLYDDSSLADNMATIKLKSGMLLKITTKTDISEFLGYRIYFAYSTDENEIIYAFKSKNQILELETNSFLSVDYNNINIKIEYESKKNIKNITLNKDIIFMYNGSLLKDLNINKLKSPDIKLTLLDNNLDGEYDICFIYENNNFILGNLTYNNNIYKFYNENSVCIYEMNSDKDNVKIFSNCGVEKIENIKPDMTISVEKVTNRAKSIYKIYISDKTTHGIVNEIDGNRVYINGENKQFTNEIRDRIILGEYGKYYISYFDTIVYFNKLKNSEKIYYVIGFNALKGLANKVELKLYNTKGEFVIKSLTDKVFINDVRININNITSSDLLNKAIFIKSTNENAILSLDILVPKNDKKISETDTFTYRPAIKSIIKTRTNNITGKVEGIPYIFLNEDVPIMKIPNIYNSLDEYKYSIDNIKNMKDYMFKNVIIDAYYEDNNSIPILIIWKENNNDRLIEDGKLIIINKISNVVDENGEEIYKLTDVRDNIYYLYKDKGSNVKKNDIIRAYIDKKNNILDFKVVVEYKLQRDYQISTGAQELLHWGSVIFGKVAKIDLKNSIITIDVSNNNIPNIYELPLIGKEKSYYLFNKTKECYLPTYESETDIGDDVILIYKETGLCEFITFK